VAKIILFHVRPSSCRTARHSFFVDILLLVRVQGARDVNDWIRDCICILSLYVTAMCVCYTEPHSSELFCAALYFVDDAACDELFDCFGRQRHNTHKDDMSGVSGSSGLVG
jgi:hypothetical protein